MKNLLFLVFMMSTLILTNCSRKTYLGSLQKVVRSQNNGEIYLKKGTYRLSEAITIPANVTIYADSTTFLVSKECPVALKIKNVKKVKIVGLTISYEKKPKVLSKIELQKYNAYKAIDIYQSADVSLIGIHLLDMPYRAMRIEGSNNIDILDCVIDNIGMPITDKAAYSVDGIFIGGREEVKNVNIVNCDFLNLGDYKRTDLHHDADGIHLQSTTRLSGITIDSCTFISCPTRGVKIQSGKDIKIKNSKFEYCGSAISASMASSVNGLLIDNNEVTRCIYPFGSNSITPLVLYGLVLTNNKVDECSNFFRTNGKSDVVNFRIEGNEVGKISTCFLIGRFKEGEIISNRISKYATAGNKSLNMSILLSPESENIDISKNKFGKTSTTDRPIVNKSKSKTIKMKSNN